MKRAREPSNKTAGKGIPPTSAPVPAPAPAPAPAGTAGSQRPAERREMSSQSTPSASLLVPLPPPPPIQPFSDDSGEEDGTSQGGSSSSSSSSSGGSVEGGEPKRARKEQKEVEGWRTRALAIIDGGEPSRGGENGTSKRKFAVVCSSNVNRSIMAEILLQKHDMRVRSFGTGREVKLPGKDSKSPQSFPFGTPYVEIRDFLARQNEALFRRNSVLGLLERDAATKRAPERWQSLDSEDVASFDVVVCFESRVFDLVVEDLHQRDPDTFKPLHVVSMTIRDSAEDSAAAAGDVLELCKMLDDCDDLDSDAPKLLSGFRSRSKRTVLHQVCHI